MLRIISRSVLPLLCGSQILLNLHLVPEASPREAQRLLRELPIEHGEPALPNKLSVALRLNSEACGSLLSYNLFISTLAFLCSLALLREGKRSDEA
jgi:hypothetical protein